MKRLFSLLFFSQLLFSGIIYAQPGKSIKSISLDQLLGKKKTENAVQSTTNPQSNVSQQGYREHIGAIGSVLERIELKGSALTQDKISTPYRRYVLNGTMDLGGKTISMPDGCILDLENGSLKNGSIKMNTTLVTPIYGISKERNISKVKVSGEYYETLVDLWGEQTEPLFPWDTTAPKKVYMVDLKKFGITPGYQKRGNDNHYTDKQYDLMYNNGIGFTKAIRWAYDNGYDGIRFPKNDYCFTPRTTKNEKPQEGPMVLIQNLDKFDIDFGGASYYLVLDSSKKSKYYVLSPERPYDQGGSMFFVSSCINVQLHNGFLIGDRALRDYSDPMEPIYEKTRAFELSGYCQNLRLHHLDLSAFMADGLCCAQAGGVWYGYDGIYQGIWRARPGKSLPIVSDNSFSTVSNFFHVDYLYTSDFAKDSPIVKKIAARRPVSINNNQGYTRLINTYHNLEVLTFNEDYSTSIPLRTLKTSYLETFFLNPEETGVVVKSSYDEGVGEEGIQHSETISELISSNLVIEYCNIHDNHRGGISGGSNNVIIRNSTFSKSHNLENYKHKTIPLYQVAGTNYHINFEDNYAKGLIVSNCRFTRSKWTIGKLLFGVYTLDFHDNISDVPITVYNCILAHVHNNKFSDLAIGYMPWRLSDYDSGLQKCGFKYLTRVLYVHDNYVKKQSVSDKNTRSILFYYNNQIMD